MIWFIILFYDWCLFGSYYWTLVSLLSLCCSFWFSWFTLSKVVLCSWALFVDSILCCYGPQAFFAINLILSIIHTLNQGGSQRPIHNDNYLTPDLTGEFSSGEFRESFVSNDSLRGMNSQSLFLTPGSPAYTQLVWTSSAAACRQSGLDFLGLRLNLLRLETTKRKAQVPVQWQSRRIPGPGWNSAVRCRGPCCWPPYGKKVSDALNNRVMRIRYVRIDNKASLIIGWPYLNFK